MDKRTLKIRKDWVTETIQNLEDGDMIIIAKSRLNSNLPNAQDILESLK